MNKPALGRFNRNTVLTLLATGAVLAAIGWSLIQAFAGGEEGPGRKTAGAEAPAFEAVLTDGSPVKLADYRGRTVAVNFWASWCEPCVREMPLLAGLEEATGGSMAAVFVNVGESRGTVTDYLSSAGFTFPVIIDAAGRIAGPYGVQGLPTTVIVNPEGRIGETVIGELTEEALAELMPQS